MQSHIIKTEEEFKEFYSWYLENRTNIDLVAFDLETDSVEEIKANIYGVGLAFSEDEAFYIAIKNKDGQTYFSDNKGIYNSINEILRDYGHRVVGHNIIYDALVWYHNTGFNIDKDIYADTILMKHCLDEEPPFGLKEIAVHYLGEWADKAQGRLMENIKANGGSTTKDNLQMYKADTEVLGEYCCWDVMLTMRLFNLFQPRLEQEGLLKLFYEEEVMPLYKEVTIKMKERGFPVDVAYFQQLRKEITIDIDSLELKVMEQLEETVYDFMAELLNEKSPIKKTGSYPKAYAKLIGLELDSIAKKKIESINPINETQLNFKQWMLGEVELSGPVLQAQLKLYFDKFPDQNYVFNLRSKAHLKRLFFEILGEKELSTTEGGEPQVDDTFLESVSSKYKWIAPLQDLNKLEKIKGTYIEGILDRQVSGIIYTSFLQFGTTSGRFASRNPNCLSLDTEVLTSNGFKKYNEISPETLIATYDGTKILFENPTNIYLSELANKNMVSVKNQHFDMRLTDNHRVVWVDRKTKELKEVPANKFPKDGHILHGAFSHTSEFGFFLPWLQFLVAAQADAEIRKDSSRIRFVFTKERKYKRLLSILSNFKYSFEDKSKGDRFEILVDGVKPAILDTIGYSKTFPLNWVTMGTKERETVLNEIFEWDGLSTRKNNYSSNCESNIDFIQALCVLQGWRAHKRTYRSARSTEDNFQLDITRRNYSSTANSLVEIENTIEQVWCVSVPSEKIVVRRGSDTFITGNCQNLPRVKEEDSGLSPMVLKYSNAIRKGFVAPKGYCIVDADYSALEPRAFAHMSGDKNLQLIFHSGEDMYSAIAKRIFNLKDVSTFKKDSNFLGKLYPEKRQIVKAMALAVTYGAEAFRIGDLLGVDRDEAQRLIDMYLESYPGLKKYIQKCHYEANNYGAVRTIFGRVRHLPDAKRIHKEHGYNILDSRWAKKKGLGDERRLYKNKLNNSTNFKIQGLAAHIVNRAMVQINREFNNKGVDGWVALQIHDQIACIVNDSHKAEAKKIVQDVMENIVKLDVPLIAEPKIAYNMKDSH